MDSEKEPDKEEAEGTFPDADKISANEESSSNLPGAPAAEKKPYEYNKHDFKPKRAAVEDKRNFILKVYDLHYKKLLVLPAAVIAICAAILLFSFVSTGEFFQKDVSIKGGVTVTVMAPYENLGELESFLTAELGKSVNARTLSQAGVGRGVIIDAGIESDADVEKFLSLIQEKTGALSEEQYSVQVVGSSLGGSFFSQVMKSIVAAFILMAIVVFLYFKIAAGRWIIVPSGFVIWTVFVDIMCTFAVISLLNVKVSAAGLAAFLMLIGYSVDTDILLTMRVLKGKQERIFDRITSAAKTGIFMTLTGMAAITAGLLVAQSETIRQIMMILVIGLAFDLLHTWITNAAILRWYMERNKYGARQ